MNYVNIYFKDMRKKHIIIQHIDDEEFEKKILKSTGINGDNYIVFDAYEGAAYTIVLFRQKGDVI